MKLLVASAFYEMYRSEFWYEMQLKYLSRTCHFDHMVYLTNADEAVFDRSDVVGTTTQEKEYVYVGGDKTNLTSHHIAMKRFLQEFRSRPGYDAYVILDSDCFPIAHDWAEHILERIETWGKDFAAIVRTENLDLFAHPSAVIIPPRSLPVLDVVPKQKKNMLGQNVVDNGFDNESIYPLIRTNARNYHPIFAGIYYNRFYHHACGSRETHKQTFRSVAADYYRYDAVQTAAIEAKLFSWLRDDPDTFLAMLTDLSDPVC